MIFFVFAGLFFKGEIGLKREDPDDDGVAKIKPHGVQGLGQPLEGDADESDGEKMNDSSQSYMP